MPVREQRSIEVTSISCKMDAKETLPMSLELVSSDAKVVYQKVSLALFLSTCLRKRLCALSSAAVCTL